jgi:hypothetical protein
MSAILDLETLQADFWDDGIGMETAKNGRSRVKLRVSWEQNGTHTHIYINTHIYIYTYKMFIDIQIIYIYIFGSHQKISDVERKRFLAEHSLLAEK